MGGEHIVSFHGKGNPCGFIHKNGNKDIKVSESDLEIWPKIKSAVLEFLENTDNEKLSRYIVEVRRFQSPEDITLDWSYRLDNTIVGDVLHDVAKILMLAFPGKICGYFDRCDICNDFPGEKYDDCTAPYWCYNDIPKFKLYKLPDDIKILLACRSSELIADLKIEIQYYSDLMGKRHSCDSLDELKKLVHELKSQRSIITRLSGYIENVIELNGVTVGIMTHSL